MFTFFNVATRNFKVACGVPFVILGDSAAPEVGGFAFVKCVALGKCVTCFPCFSLLLCKQGAHSDDKE